MYINITLKWYYTNYTVQLFMPGCVRAALSKYIPLKQLQQQDSPYPWVVPHYSINSIQLVLLSNNSPTLIEAQLTQHHTIIDTFLYYDRFV